MKPLTKLERQYVAYWAMNILSDHIRGLPSGWSMQRPESAYTDVRFSRLDELVDAIVELSGGIYGVNVIVKAPRS
jgi:hypothetical protein